MVEDGGASGSGGSTSGGSRRRKRPSTPRALAVLEVSATDYFPPYVDLEKIEAAARGEEEGLRQELEKLREDKAEARRELQDLRQRGTLWLVLTYLANRWFDSLRRNHTWGSVFATPREDLLVVTRPQRVLILTSSCLASMAVNALFFGSSADRISARFLGALISAVCMVPIERLTPHLFAFVNTFRSDTLDISYAVRQKRRDELEKRRSRLLGPNHGIKNAGKPGRSSSTAPMPVPVGGNAEKNAAAMSAEQKQIASGSTAARPDSRAKSVDPIDVVETIGAGPASSTAAQNHKVDDNGVWSGWLQSNTVSGGHAGSAGKSDG